ncbi:hypothetical protein ALI22I_29600 [Saccharothrix sp. ALI-22-I]|uniref:DUF4328 domain-containing protein n=1 Tax=Saccharothrix sp. ALI-22-I TaxID=1933778 RepID=UPI00097C0B09|nr:DUF4328 domain-containing protein [Saccharothrix sp. ALI-22-I]ONI84684.1 hypothetical protein ALI22I_29600 [Saccharothrix sp. ALI-22-I]
MRGLGVAFVVLVSLTTLSDVIFAGWVWHLRDVLSDYIGEVVGESELDRTLATTGLLELGNIALYAGAGVVFVVWLWRVRSNADLVAPYEHHYRKGWAIWGWLPIVSLWIPRRLTVDVWRISQPRHDLGRSHSEVNWWWGLFLGYQVTDRIADRVLTDAETVDALGIGAAMEVLAALLSVAAAALAIVVVRRIGEWQDAPGFVTPDEIVSPTSAGLAPVDLPRQSPIVVAPPRDDPRWQRPE